MPPTEVQAFRDRNGEVPLQDWLDEIESREPKAYQKCLARILDLSRKGYEMRRSSRRPVAPRDLRTAGIVFGNSLPHAHFFFGKSCVAVSHGITKEDRVPPKEIELAIARMELVKRDPLKYTTAFDFEDGEL